MDARSFARLAGVALIAVLMPALAFAQASITGVVRDTSGAVLPGVTVEAASPALIEKVRSSVTNDTGQYRIENLRPGTYSVTFTLGGFSGVKRDGVELQGSFSATINADLRVGEISETVTVTGESPIVDVQNTTQQRVLSHEIIDAIPTGRSDKNLATLIPGVSIAGGISQDVGGTQDQVSSQLTVHGSRGTDQRLTQNGVSLGITANGANTLIVATNLSAYQEVTIDTGAVSAELATGGVRVNYIPKDGGNRLSGTMVFGFGNGGMQSDNFSEALRAAGLGTPNCAEAKLRLQPGHRRSNPPRQAVVPRRLQEAEHRGVSRRDVCEPQRQQPECVDVCARRVEPAVQRGRRVGSPRPSHMAGAAEAEVRLQRSGVRLLRVHRRHQCHHLARGGAPPQHPEAAQPDGRLDGPADQ